MISKVYDIIYDHIHDLTYDITVNPHINTILQANDFNVSIPIAQAIGAWQRRGVELGSGEERKAAD